MEYNYTGNNCYFPLTSEVKTEIMHNAAYILREQAQSTEEFGIQKLENVVNLNDGVMRNLLRAGKFSRRRPRVGTSFDALVQQEEAEREKMEMQHRRSQSMSQ